MESLKKFVNKAPEVFQKNHRKNFQKKKSEKAVKFSINVSLEKCLKESFPEKFQTSDFAGRISEAIGGRFYAWIYERGFS